MPLADPDRPDARPVAPPRRGVAWACLLVAIASGAGGTSALARTRGFTLLQPSVLALACYAVCFLALTRALRVIPVSIAYAVWSGLGIALVTGIAWAGFGQPLRPGELLGIGLILAGTVVIQLWSRAAQVAEDRPQPPTGGMEQVVGCDTWSDRKRRSVRKP